MSCGRTEATKFQAWSVQVDPGLGGDDDDETDDEYSGWE